MKFLKDDKIVMKNVINLITRNKKGEIRMPELADDNELKEEYLNY